MGNMTAGIKVTSNQTVVSLKSNFDLFLLGLNLKLEKIVRSGSV